MARGKAAAQTANRRLAEAQERIAELERLLADERDQRRVETFELRAECDRLRGKLGRDVRDLSEKQITAIRHAASEEVLEVKERHARQVVSGLLLLGDMCNLVIDQHRIGELEAEFGVAPRYLSNKIGHWCGYPSSGSEDVDEKYAPKIFKVNGESVAKLPSRIRLAGRGG